MKTRKPDKLKSAKSDLDAALADYIKANKEIKIALDAMRTAQLSQDRRTSYKHKRLTYVSSE